MLAAALPLNPAPRIAANWIRQILRRPLNVRIIAPARNITPASRATTFAAIHASGR